MPRDRSDMDLNDAIDRIEDLTSDEDKTEYAQAATTVLAALAWSQAENARLRAERAEMDARLTYAHDRKGGPRMNQWMAPDVPPREGD